jgi:cytochrome c oxidase subunit II
MRSFGQGPHRTRPVGRLAPPALAAVALLQAGCGNQSALSPEGRPARDIETLWWWMLVAAGIVFFGAIVMLAMSWWRRRAKGLPWLGEREGATNRLVVVFGIAIPIVVLVSLFVVANLVVAKNTEAPAVGSTRLTIRVIGHQWFWEVRYPGTAAVTANEIHIPVRTRVDVLASTADVLHSFWVPELNRKIDMINARTNRVLLVADRPGVYRGQCAELCGLQHAHMALKVIAEPAGRFRRWLANMAAPAAPPRGGAAQRGQQVFLAEQCASCHTIRGTAANGRVGPDLTHVASRRTLAALTIPNTRANLVAWIRDPQRIKPGNKMPALGLSNARIDAVADYLAGLR